MLFNSYLFLFGFLPVVFMVFLALRRQAWRVAFLVVASYVFYAYAQWWFPALMAASTLIAFSTGRLLELERSWGRGREKWILSSGIAGALGLLLYFKYAQFVTHSSVGVLHILTKRGFPSVEAFTSHIVLPIGISFFTFEAISYMVDVYRKDVEVERNIVRFAFFISFFPHLVAGPIVRYSKLRPQLQQFYRLDLGQLTDGLGLLAAGLVKKVVIADSIAARTDAALAQPSSVGFAAAWLGMIGYSFQIYFDFAGYCDMALGLARMFGIELPWNFDRPYRARSPQEFWRRWHVTLSSWLRDYLYIPLGGSRKGERRRDANLLVTMGLGGLWHGAAFSFMGWGLYHGGLLVAHRHLQRLNVRLAATVATALTFVLVTIGWVFFRMRGAHAVGSTFAGMLGLHGLGGVPTDLLPWLAVAALLMWGVPEEWRWRFSAWPAWRLAPVGFALASALLLLNTTTRFIYFRF